MVAQAPHSALYNQPNIHQSHSENHALIPVQNPLHKIIKTLFQLLFQKDNYLLLVDDSKLAELNDIMFSDYYTNLKKSMKKQLIK